MQPTEPTSALAKQLQASLEMELTTKVVHAMCPKCLREFLASYLPGMKHYPGDDRWIVWCNSCRRIYTELRPRLRSRPGQLYLPGLLDSEELPAPSVRSASRRKRS